MSEEKNGTSINALKLKSRIMELGLKQEEIAKSMGLDKSTFNLKINNKRRMYLDEVSKLCSILKINTSSGFKEYFGLDFLILYDSRENATTENGGDA